MLLELHVRNFAIAERVDLTFRPGFNVLTGETGAGKSIVVDALLFLLGARIGSDVIRTGADGCLVEGLFDLTGVPHVGELLDELGIERDDGQLVLVREMSSSGRSRCRVNGRLVTVSVLGRIAQHLVDIHGQHDHQALLKPEAHLTWLDLYAGEEAAGLARRVSGLWRRYRDTVRKLTEWETQSRERERRRDLLLFQLNEIDAAQLKIGEDEELRARHRVLANAEKLFETLATGYNNLRDGFGEGPGAVDLLEATAQLLSEAVQWLPEIAAVVELVESAAAQAGEAAHMLRQARDRVQADPAELARVEERLALIDRLQRKYGDDVAAILAYRDDIARELSSEELSEEGYQRLTEERETLHDDLVSAASELSRVRREAALRLEQEMAQELSALSLENAQFTVAISHVPSEAPDAIAIDGSRLTCSERGIDRVEFLFSANPGESPRPLAKIASGGELSRTMLALKSLMARHDAVPTLIFDEVDAGIGGRTATAVAQRIARLAQSHQVLVVTHLAQIACVADHHMHVEKVTAAGRTTSSVRTLSRDERVLEIARMLDGTTSETTLQRAKELLATQPGKPRKAV